MLKSEMLLVASSRNLNMKEVLKHPLGPLPWSLANCDGTMKKTNEAALARKLENMASTTEQVQQPSACMIDGMSLVQKMKGKNHTFDDVDAPRFDLTSCITASITQEKFNAGHLSFKSHYQYTCVSVNCIIWPLKVQILL